MVHHQRSPHQRRQTQQSHRSNSAIARHFAVTDAAIAKHVNILAKLDLPPDTDGHRRVLAVLAYLQRDDFHI